MAGLFRGRRCPELEGAALLAVSVLLYWLNGESWWLFALFSVFLRWWGRGESDAPSVTDHAKTKIPARAAASAAAAARSAAASVGDSAKMSSR